MQNRSADERFEDAYTRLWAVLHRPDDPDLTQHERGLLHHVPATGGVPLGDLAHHLALPKSTASVLVKGLERRGFLRRRRDPADERRLAIVLTAKGRRRVEADRVLDPDGLAAALDTLPPSRRELLLRLMERVAAAAERGVRPG